MGEMLRQMKYLYFGPPPGKGLIQDLEYAMRTKGGLTPEEDTMLRLANFLPTGISAVFSGLGSYLGWFGIGLANKLHGYPPLPGFVRFFAATACAYTCGKATYRQTLHECPVVLLDEEEGRMKMELANIILTKHRDDVYLVKAVKRHFFSEHLFDDLHQDQPLFRWHPRRSYTDSAFAERMKEIEAVASDDEAGSVSNQTNVNNRPFGDLMEDPLACILGSQGNDMESNKTPGNTSTVLKRSELRAHRRSHRRHHHRHADDKFAAL